MASLNWPADDAAKEGAPAAGPSSTSRPQEETCLRALFLREHPALLHKFTDDVLPLMLSVYTSSGTPGVKRQCLTVVAQMLHFNDGPTLAVLTENIPISSFIAALLGAKDSVVVAHGMQVGLAGVLALKGGCLVGRR